MKIIINVLNEEKIEIINALEEANFAPFLIKEICDEKRIMKSKL